MYFHNLKFDGSFILDYILNERWTFCNKMDYDMPPRTFKALISDKNKFYSISLKTSYGVIEFWDSAKLVPFALAEAGNAFETKHRKLTMEYEGYRYPNCSISDIEKQYILNDILCLKEIMVYMINNGHKKMTIGSCCLDEFKSDFDSHIFQAYFPNLNSVECPLYPELSIDAYIRKTYRGAWCYCKEPGKFGSGRTFDINSLYPFVLHSSSGTYYPVGFPKFFSGEIPDKVYEKGIVWFVHIRCSFELKENYLPTVQIKNNYLYKSNEWLTTSRIKYRGKYYKELVDKNGNRATNIVELFLTHYGLLARWEFLIHMLINGM